MNDDSTFTVGFLTGLGMGMGAMLLIGIAIAQDDYRQGQIDAANGVMKYELKQLPTGETVWVKKGTQ